MIFVIGGSYQGKTEFANSLQLPVIDDLELQILQWRNEQVDMDAKIATLLQQENCVIVCREVGCGVIPIEKEERIYRELVGRTACKVAKRAKEVYKVEAGIALKIKG